MILGRSRHGMHIAISQGVYVKLLFARTSVECILILMDKWQCGAFVNEEGLISDNSGATSNTNLDNSMYSI